MINRLFDYDSYVNSFFDYPTLIGLQHFQLISGEIFLLAAILYLLLWVAIKFPNIKPDDLNQYVSFVVFFSILISLITPGTLHHGHIIFNSLLIVDNFTIGGKLIFLFFMAYISLNSFTVFSTPEILNTNLAKRIEYHIIFLFISLFGSLLISSFDFIILYITLEGLSLILFVLLIFNPNSHANTEAGVKYFCLSVFTSCFLGFGISILYGMFGTTNFLDIREFITYEYLEMSVSHKILLSLAIFFVFAAFLFKLGASPFQFWVAEVYAGTETLVTSLFIIPIKFTFFLVFCRLIGFIFHPILPQLQFFLLVFAISSIIIGTVGALWQDNIKKFIAFTSVNQIGFLLLACASGTPAGFTAALFNLFFYSVANLGFFVFLINTYDKISFKKIETLNELSRFGVLYPAQSLLLSILILSMAGIPPLAGFFGKFFILVASTEVYFVTTTFLALLVTVISAFYYIRLIKNIFFDAQNNFRNDNLRFATPTDKFIFCNLEFSAPKATLFVCALILILAFTKLSSAFEIFSEMTDALMYPLNLTPVPCKATPRTIEDIFTDATELILDPQYLTDNMSEELFEMLIA